MFEADFDYFNWIILPILIFLSRLCDVSLATLRHVFMAKGFKKIVPVLGFFEVLLWLIMIGQVMKNLNNFLCYIAWAGGFAAGTYIGLLIEERLALGLQVLRIITNQECSSLVDALKKANHGITVIEGYGAKGPVKIIFSVVKRKNVEAVTGLINIHNPTAFYSVEDIKTTNQGGVFSVQEARNFSALRDMFSYRKGK